MHASPRMTKRQSRSEPFARTWTQENARGLFLTGLAPEVETRLEAVTPSAYKRYAHHWLILHGRYVCTALRPRCPACLINDLCRFPEKTAAAPAA